MEARERIKVAQAVQADAAQQVAAGLRPAPPDDEILDLFKAFAAAMPPEVKAPLLHLEGGNFTQIAKGWKLVLSGWGSPPKGKMIDEVRENLVPHWSRLDGADLTRATETVGCLVVRADGEPLVAEVSMVGS